MTAKTKTKSFSFKQSLISAALGVGASFAVSLITAWIAMKTKDPLSVAGTMAAVCALCGALCASLLGGMRQKGVIGGVCACAIYTVFYVLVSLPFPSSTGKPLILLGVSVLGGLLGVALTAKRGGNARKHVKKYVKRAKS